MTSDARVAGELIACRACGAPAGSERIRIRELMFGTREPFEYVRCDRCASLSIVEVPDDLARHYPPRYHDNSSEELAPVEPAWRLMAIRRLVAEKAFGIRSPLTSLARRIASIPDGYAQVRRIIIDGQLRSFGAPVLDVGCGARPVRLAILRRLGYRRLVGVDPFIAATIRTMGVDVIKGDIDAVGGQFRVVMFHHSLEHVHDPAAVLASARARLGRGGRVLIRTPIIGGVLWQRYGTDWVELDAPRHLVLFSDEGVHRLAERTGFQVIKTTWESSAWEFIASEQYARDLGMYEPGSWFVDPAGANVDDAAMERFATLATQANDDGTAGRAAFWLRPT